MLNKFSFVKLYTRSFSKLLSATVLIGGLVTCSCNEPKKPNVNNSSESYNSSIAMIDYDLGKPVTVAVANVKGIQDNQVNGTVTFTKVEGGIRIVADLEGLKPGDHGFHIHEFGDCGDKGSAAGGHFNPSKHKHGGPDSPERHVGDLGNITADAKGHGHYDRIDKMVAFEGENSIIGRSVIIHSDPDDFTSQPAGNSGDRIGCGIIEPPAAF